MPTPHTTDHAETPFPGWVVPVLSLLLAAFVLGLYAGSLDGAFVYDDLLLVKEAPATQSIGGALQHVFDPYWQFANVESDLQRGLWRPLTSLALAVGKTLGGGEPFGYHLVSVLLHVAASVALFRLAALLFRTRGFKTRGRAECAALIAALVFAAHPAQVEAVAWISAVNDPAWGALGLLGLGLYERAALRGRLSFAAAALFFLALAAKETAVVLTGIALLLDLTARRRPRALALILLAAPVAAWYALRTVVFDGLEAGLFRPHGDFSLDATREWTLRLELFGGFLGNALWPTEPAVFRPVQQVLPEGSNALLTAGAWTLGWALVLAFAWLRGLRSLAFGAAAFALFVLPIIAIPANAGLFPLSDRYIYVGVGVLAIGVLSALGQSRAWLPLAALGACTVPLLARESLQHAPRFEDNLAFRAAGVADAPNSPNTLWGAGNAYFQEFIRTQDTSWLVQSYLHHLRSLRAGTIYPDGPYDNPDLEPHVQMQLLERLIMETPPEKRRRDPSVLVTPLDRLHATLGQIRANLELARLAKDPDLEYTLDLAREAKRLWTTRPEFDTFSADFDALISRIHRVRGDIDEAKAAIAQALQRSPSDPVYLSNLGDILMDLGDFDGARASYQRALERAPQNVELWIKHASAALEGKQFPIAERSAKKAIEVSERKSASAMAALASVQNRRGLPAEALEILDRALEIDDGNGDVHKQRGVAFLRMGNSEAALESFSEAARLLPDDFPANYQVAALLLRYEPAEDAPDEERARWLSGIEDVLVRAYLLAPRDGELQLGLQQQLERLVGNDPDSAFSLATVLGKQRRPSLALFWLKRVTELGDQWPEKKRETNLCFAYTEIGEMYKRLGRKDDAIEALREAVKRNDRHFKAQLELGLLLFEKGDKEGAGVALERANDLFSGAGVRREMREAVQATIQRTLSLIEASRTAASGSDGG